MVGGEEGEEDSDEEMADARLDGEAPSTTNAALMHACSAQ